MDKVARQEITNFGIFCLYTLSIINNQVEMDKVAKNGLPPLMKLHTFISQIYSDS